MFGSTILEVAIGMVFVYLLISLLCSALAELIEARLRLRWKDLQKGISLLLTDPGLVQTLNGHPLIKALGDRPSYIPSRTFSLALWNIATTAGQAAAGAPVLTRNLRQIRATIEALPKQDVRDALLALIDEAGDDLDRARKNIERWYDDVMDRVSGWYKRRTQWILLAIGLGAALALNVDSITVVNALSHDAALRSALVATAEGYAARPPAPQENPEAEIQESFDRISKLGLPLGWTLKEGYETNPRGIPRETGPYGRDLIVWILLKLLGFSATALAVSLGAPFWFDVLNKFMVVRSTVKPREKSQEVPTKDKPAPETEVEKEEGKE